MAIDFASLNGDWGFSAPLSLVSTFSGGRGEGGVSCFLAGQVCVYPDMYNVAS